MCNKGISGRQYNLWILSALSAPLAQIGAGCSWVVVLLTGLLCAAVCWVLQRMDNREMTGGKLLRIVNLIWVAMVLSQLCHYPTLVWPKNESPVAVPLTLLVLAAWSADRGVERASRAGNGIFWFLLILYGVVTVSAVKEVHLENLTKQMLTFDPMLVVIFLAPSVIRVNQKGVEAALLGDVVFGVLLSIITTGVLSMEVAGMVEVPIYELSRSVSFLGIAERFESLIASAITLGYFVLFSLLLSSNAYGKLGVWICTLIAAAAFIGNIQISSWYLLIGCIIVWFILPMSGNIFSKIKMKKGVDKWGRK